LSHIPNSIIAQQVYLSDAQSIVRGLQRRSDGGRSAFLLDSSTIDPTAARAVAAEVQKTLGGDAAMLDTPVSGGVLVRVESRPICGSRS
jgi:3-hydroxyisobutyrate dehydrogenase-like beta-hydroxyacid dehydrogenase